MRSKRWLLWSALLLVLALLGVLVFLASQYESAREQEALERDAGQLANELRNALVRDVQTLQSVQQPPPAMLSWLDPIGELFSLQRDMVRIEWRDRQMRRSAERESPFQPIRGPLLARGQADPYVRIACEGAARVSGPHFSSSYFWPGADGRGLELIEMCLPRSSAGHGNGFLVVTYSLSAWLERLANNPLLRGRNLVFAEADGTQLAQHSNLAKGRPHISASGLLDLPGHTLLLRLESARRPQALFPNVLTAVVGALSLALLSVLALLGRDIRRRQKAEQALADALAFRQAMENSLVTGLRASDNGGRITYVNPAFCEMVGFSAAQLIGSGLPAPYWPPELQDEYQQRRSLRLAERSQPREGFESTFVHRNGSRFPVLIFEARLIDAQGQPRGWMSAILNLSEQRRIEDLNRAQQERLQASARLAMMGEMASLLSHELNQPLAAIASYATGSLNLLRSNEAQGGPDWLPDMAQAVGEIAQQAQRAGRVIQSVSDLVRRRDLVRETLAPAELLQAILPLLRLQASKGAIQLDIEVAPDTPLVHCDRTQVEQVLLNLARNGMQAMPVGEPPQRSGLRRLRIQVRPSSAADAGDSSEAGGDGPDAMAGVVFEVADHGSGISAAVHAQMFTPFFTTKADGMGLGLSLCRTVIEQHGARLYHRPQAVAGTVFGFVLPAAHGDPPRNSA